MTLGHPPDHLVARCSRPSFLPGTRPLVVITLLFARRRRFIAIARTFISRTVSRSLFLAYIPSCIVPRSRLQLCPLSFARSLLYFSCHATHTLHSDAVSFSGSAHASCWIALACRQGHMGTESHFVCHCVVQRKSASLCGSYPTWRVDELYVTAATGRYPACSQSAQDLLKIAPIFYE